MYRGGSIVKLHRPSDDLLELKHDGVTSAWFMLTILIGTVLCAAIYSYLAGTIWQVALVLLIACFVIHIMKKASAVTTVVFDRARGTVTATHRRDGAIIDETVIRFEDISNVIVDASRGNRPHRASMRPALLVGDSLVPLVWGQFLAPAASRDIVTEVRRFLGLPQDELIEDSVCALVRRGRKLDAMALARHKFGLRLSRDEATKLVTELYEGT